MIGCRKCNHLHWFIIDNLGEIIVPQGCAKPGCKCQKENFAPDDNLEYLEYEYNKRSKI